MADAIQKENTHLGHRERLKQRFFVEGLDNFEDHQILELLLFYAIPQKDTNDLAHTLLKTFGSLSGVFDAHPKELQKTNGIGEHSSVLLSMMSGLTRAYVRSATRERPRLDGTTSAYEYIKTFLMNRIYEVFYIFFLDNSNRIIYEEEICEGTLDEINCYPRTVLEKVFRHNAKKIILAHNHPSGQLRPSPSDIETTQNLVEILGKLDIEVTDHIIVGKDDYLSMAEIGCLK